MYKRCSETAGRKQHTLCTCCCQQQTLKCQLASKGRHKIQIQQWYGEIIFQQLQNKLSKPVNMRLSVLKPSSAKWTIDTCHYTKTQTSIISNNFCTAGIVDCLSRSTLHSEASLKPVQLAGVEPASYGTT